MRLTAFWRWKTPWRSRGEVRRWLSFNRPVALGDRPLSIVRSYENRHPQEERLAETGISPAPCSSPSPPAVHTRSESASSAMRGQPWGSWTNGATLGPLPGGAPPWGDGPGPSGR